MQIVTSKHGNLMGLSASGELIVSGGLVAGSHGSQAAYPSPRTVAFNDEFDGAGQAYSTTPINGWLARKGTTNAVDWTVTEAVGGTIVGKVGDTTASMAVSGVQLSRGLSYKANQGGLFVEGRVKLGIITNIAFFFGFTDQVAALEMPINSATGAHTVTTNATDACGFLFDTADTSADQWLLTGVATDVDATVQSGLGAAGVALAPVADTYATLRVELSPTGVATFYYNGKQVGTAMSGAVTATVALTPVLAGFNRTTANGATTIFTMDRFSIGALRV